MCGVGQFRNRKQIRSKSLLDRFLPFAFSGIARNKLQKSKGTSDARLLRTQCDALHLEKLSIRTRLICRPGRRIQDAEIPPLLILERGLAVRVQKITFVQNRLRDVVNAIAAHETGCSRSAIANIRSIASSKVAIPMFILYRYSWSNTSRRRFKQVEFGKCRSIKFFQTCTGRRKFASLFQEIGATCKAPPPGSKKTEPLNRNVRGISPSSIPRKYLAVATLQSKEHGRIRG